MCYGSAFSIRSTSKAIIKSKRYAIFFSVGRANILDKAESYKYPENFSLKALRIFFNLLRTLEPVDIIHLWFSINSNTARLILIMHLIIQLLYLTY